MRFLLDQRTTKIRNPTASTIPIRVCEVNIFVFGAKLAFRRVKLFLDRYIAVSLSFPNATYYYNKIKMLIIIIDDIYLGVNEFFS